MIKDITYRNAILAKIIKPNYEKEGIEFYTPDNFSQQVGFMNRKKYKIQPHIHRRKSRKLIILMKFYILRKEKLKSIFYSNSKNIYVVKF